MDFWKELERKSGGSPTPAAPSWGGGTPTYKPPTSAATPTTGLAPPARTTDPVKTFGNDPTDRAYAYQPRQEQGYVEEYRPPTFWQILADLGLRALEAAIGAAAYEMAVFFTRRRFVPPRDNDRR
jgi:hypothetical protein